MKFQLSIFVILILFVLSNKAEAQWERSMLYPNSAGAHSVKFIDQNNGFTAGGSGAVFRTTDKGKTWINCSIPTATQFYSVTAVSQLNFWVCGIGGAIYGTTDGGLTWNDYSISISGDLNSIFFVDINLGFAVSSYGAILKTTNGGNTWDSQSFTANFHDIFFINAQIGWAVSNGIWKTTDGGETWTNTVSLYNELTSIYFLDENIGYFTGVRSGGSGAGIYKTTDGGSSLDGLSTLFLSSMNSINFIDYNIGWAVGPYTTILKTTNGGDDWENHSPNFMTKKENPPNVLTASMPNGYFTDENTGYVTGGSGLIQTTDGGNNWRRQAFQLSNLSSIKAFDHNTCWAVGGPGILKTEDAGETWSITTPESFPFNMTPSFTDVYFINSTHGWVCGGNGFIFKTTNGGVDWVEQSSYEHRLLRTIYFTDQNNGWAAGTDISFNDVLLSTTNGGSTWIDRDMSTTDDFSSLFFINPNVGWLASNLRLYKTTNGGIEWIVNTTNITMSNSIFFINENIGWVAGHKLYKTTDGGLNWNESVRPLPTGWQTNIIYEIYFSDESKGWAGTADGIYYTSDGGQSWVKQGESTYTYSISFSDQNYGWAVGPGEWIGGYGYATILKTTNGGGVTFIEEVNNEIAGNFILKQNYPNPFNPSTVISYQLPAFSKVTLKVYDILGNEIAVLVNEEKSPGKYEIEWNAENFSSGVYFYKLQAGQFSAVKKLILIK